MRENYNGNKKRKEEARRKKQEEKRNKRQNKNKEVQVPETPAELIPPPVI
jgi:hypothetical protein